MAAAALAIALLVLSTGLPKLLVDGVFGENVLPSWPGYVLADACAVAAVRHRIARIPIARADLASIALLICLPIASAAWSVDHSTTVQHGMMFTAGAVVAFALAAVPDAVALRALARASILTAVLGFAVILLLPEVGLEQSGPLAGSWRGLQEQKNGLGSVSAFSCLVLLAALLQGRVLAQGWLLFGIAVNLALLFGAQSTTSVVVFVVSAAVLVLPRRLLSVVAISLPILALALLAAFILLPEATQPLLDLGTRSVGKDATLSNRLPIWAVLLPHAMQRPWLGFGFDAFWAPAIFPEVEFGKALNFVPSTAHNGYLETVLSIGLIGLAVLLAVLGRMAFNVAHGLRGSLDRPIDRVALAVLVMMMGLNLTESGFLARNDRLAVTLLWLAIAVARKEAPAFDPPPEPEPEREPEVPEPAPPARIRTT